MRYASFDHAGWVEQQVGKPLAPFAKRVAHIVGLIGGGIYNAPIDANRVNWHDPVCITMTWHTTMATADHPDLSLLVALCCAARVRCAISPCTPKMLRLRFWQRAEAGGYANRHPSLQEFDAMVADHIGPDHPLRYGVIEAAAEKVEPA